MCILPMWEVGGVHKTIRQMPQMQEDEILQQGMSEECLGLPQALVRCCNSVAAIVSIERPLSVPSLRRLILHIWLEVRTLLERSTAERVS